MYNEIQLTKNKMDLNIRKITNHPPSPDYQCNNIVKFSTLYYSCQVSAIAFDSIFVLAIIIHLGFMIIAKVIIIIFHFNADYISSYSINHYPSVTES